MFMSTTAPDARFAAATPKGFVAVLCRRLLALLLVAGVLIGGYETYLGWASPGALIHHDLVRAGAEVASLPWSTPIERVQQTVSRDFPGYRARADASHFPAYVTVTLQDLDRADCDAAQRVADRIEGAVVIAMEPSNEAACQERTSITWRIMP
jgi:hypothetical protein